MLNSHQASATECLDADLGDTGAILAGAARTLDFSRPVTVIPTKVLHCTPDTDDPGEIVARLASAVPPGSYLAISRRPPTCAATAWPRAPR